MSPSSVYRDVAAEVADVVAAMAGEAATEGREVEAESRLLALFDAHQARLYRLARRMSRDADSARDLVQETYLRAARSVAAVPTGPAAEAAWLVRVLVNLCRDQWRREGRGRDKSVLDRPVSPSHPEAAAIARITIWRALQRLTPRRRAAVVMYELEGIGMREIASLLGVSTVTVRWHLSRGRRELAEAVRCGVRL